MYMYVKYCKVHTAITHCTTIFLYVNIQTDITTDRGRIYFCYIDFVLIFHYPVLEEVWH